MPCPLGRLCLQGGVCVPRWGLRGADCRWEQGCVAALFSLAMIIDPHSRATAEMGGSQEAPGKTMHPEV